MLRIDKVEVYDWVGEDVIRIRGDNKGRRAKVLEVYEKAGRLMMNIEHCDTKKRTDYCSPFNYRLARHWKEKPYKPKPESIEEVKKLLADEERIIKVGEERYIAIFYNRINPRVMRYLTDKAILEKVGRLGTVLKATGSSWEQYHDQRAAQRSPWYERNVYVYKIIKEIAELQ